MQFLKNKIYIVVLIILLPLFAFSQEKIVKYDLSNGKYELKNFDIQEESKSNSPIYFIADEKEEGKGRVVLNLSTLNQDKLTISWSNSTAQRTSSRWYARLQYRLSANDEWTDVVTTKGNNIEFVSQSKRYWKDFNNIVLPEECNNKDFVQLSWKIDAYNGTTNPLILFRNIEVTSEYDKYFGMPAEVNVSMNSDEKNKQLSSIIFDNIPIPFIYPESYRIKVQGKQIRDSINLSISGEDKEYFSLSTTSIKDKAIYNKVVEIKYSPKKEGHHKAILTITTSKLASPIQINIEGSCAKHISYEKNLLPNTEINSNTAYYRIPVFSNTDYQYRFVQKDISSPIRIKYKWYRDTKLMFSMRDTVKKSLYCVPLKIPATANYLEIQLSCDNNIDISDMYFGSPKVKTMISSGNWNDENNWEPKGEPTMEDFVVINRGVNAKVNEDVACSMLTLGDSSNISINTGKTFYVSSDIFYGKNSYFTVHQYLLPGKWNYISTPINQARAAIFSMNTNNNNDTWLMKYNTGQKSKHDDYWSEYLTDPKLILEPGQGYAVYTHEPLDVKYEGLLCNSSVTYNLVTTEDDKWNLVGNPYTAPLSSKKLFDDIDGKIQGNCILLFNRESKVYNPVIIDSKEEVMIPSLESFFVEALNTPTDITFKRKHQYIPQTGTQTWVNNNYLNLSVTKNSNSQYVLLGMDPRSEYSFDEYDCHKMFGNNEDMPDIYLTDGKDEYSVNVFPDYPAIYNVGLYIGNPSQVEINLNNISVLPENIMVFLEDKKNNIFYNFCEESKVSTFLKSGTTQDEFRIHIIKAINVKEGEFEYKGLYLWQDKGRMLLYSEKTNKLEKVRVYNNRQIVLDVDYVPNEVLVKDIKQGEYTVDLFVNGVWIKDIDLTIK